MRRFSRCHCIIFLNLHICPEIGKLQNNADNFMSHDEGDEYVAYDDGMGSIHWEMGFHA